MQPIAAAAILVSFLVSPCLAYARQHGVPSFDIANTCREARGFATIDREVAYQGCMKDENDAREQLVKKWSSFKPSDRGDCVMQGAAPMPSYVELLTCLEMSAEAGALYKPDGSRRDKLKGPADQGSPGAGQATPPSDAPPPLPPLSGRGGPEKPN
ncbi:MAG: hypothetical protein L0Y50_00765 [Beijerinckiaceae bacterium]|nr:hypothetical protein [Beijerinckiaceae bacterium]MCI0734805.1 hypothetical protein [Beijerinckiaceae bacterium]